MRQLTDFRSAHLEFLGALGALYVGILSNRAALLRKNSLISGPWDVSMECDQSRSSGKWQGFGFPQKIRHPDPSTSNPQVCRRGPENDLHGALAFRIGRDCE